VKKIAGWKVGLNLDRYIRYGYLQQDDNEQLYLDWRTRAELDQKTLINSILQQQDHIAKVTQKAEDESEIREEDVE
jgi:hypothetical protein